MPDQGPNTNAERQLDRWLREEAAMPAPDRLLEDVFARTETASQDRRGWAPWRRSVAGQAARPAGRLQPVFGGLAAVLVLGLLGALVIRGFGSGPGTNALGPSPAASAGAGPSGRSAMLVIERSHATCDRQGSLTVLPGGPGIQSSAWVTCGTDSEEIVLGGDTVTARPGLGAIASDGTTDWALRGDSVVQLNADRSVARTVRIGTPSAIAVGSGAVWVLDARTGALSSIASGTVTRTVTPSPEGRPIAIAVAGGSLWVLDQTAAALLRLDVDDGHRIGSIPVATRPTFLVQAAGALYVASPVTLTIVRVDPATGESATLRPDLGPDDHMDSFAGSPDGLVVSSREWVLRLDPVTGAVLGKGRAPAYPGALGLDGSTILVLEGDGTLLETRLP